MRSNTFNYSLLAIGVAAVLGMSTSANAATGPASTNGTTTNVDITNQASASYKVSTQLQPEVLSNTVKITISEQVAFSLSADNNDTAAPTNGTQGDDKNEDEEVAPNGFAIFKHTLLNTGNRTDTYTISLSANDPKYNTVGSTVSFIAYSADNVIIRQSPPEGLTFKQANAITSELKKGEYVKFIINAKTQNNKGGDKPPLTISAKSTVLTENGAATTTLTNTDNAFTRLPTFGIVKTITNGLDLNDTSDTAEYKIVITNHTTTFSTDATQVDIADFLPAGLILAEPLTSANITASSTATVGTIVAGATDGSGFSFNVTGNTIPVGQNITFLFKVKQGGTGTLNPTNAVNHVTVTDDLDNGATTGNTLVDSTETGREQNVNLFYPTTEINNVNGQLPANIGDDSTVPLLTILRALTLSGVTIKEIAPTSGTAGQVTHTTVITNTGKDIEGSKAGELTFTIDDNDAAAPDAINIEAGSVTVTYDPNGGGTAGLVAIPIGFTTVGSVNVYDINSVIPGGIAKNGTVTINYKVSSVNAPLFTPSNSITPTFEDTIVTLIPGKEGAPTVAPVTDKTTVRGLVLLKTQAIDKTCSGTATTFVSTPLIDALPGECIIYKVQAQNTSSPAPLGFNITDVIISDALSNFKNQADYVANSATTTVAGGSATNNGTAITTTIDTLTPQGTETMQFSVKIKVDRLIP